MALRHQHGVPEGRCREIHPWRALLARELAHDGMPVKIADLDTQQTTCTGMGQ